MTYRTTLFIGKFSYSFDVQGRPPTELTMPKPLPILASMPSSDPDVNDIGRGHWRFRLRTLTEWDDNDNMLTIGRAIYDYVGEY